MKTPRNISGAELVKLLSILGYIKTGQNGSHIKVTTNQNGQHHLAIPNHNPVKIGTLNSIIRQVAEHFQTIKDDIANKIF